MVDGFALADASEAVLLASMAVCFLVLCVFGGYHVLLALVGFRASSPSDERAGRVTATGDDVPFVTFLVTAYRDADAVLNCLETIRRVDHPRARRRTLLVVDADADGTHEKVRQYLLGEGARRTWSEEGDEILRTEGTTLVLQQGSRAGRGKPRALQNALRHIPRDGWVAILDADHEVAPDFVAALAPHRHAPDVAIVQARRGPKTWPGGWVARWDVMEQNVGQIHAFLARDRIATASFYGSTALIRADVLHEVGWENCLAEDTLLHYAVRERGYRVAYAPHTGSREEPVESLRALLPQRRRWATGHMQVLYQKAPFLTQKGLRARDRMDALLHLNYYNVTLVLLTYWALRAAHYWMQVPGRLVIPVLLAAVLGGGIAARVEWHAGRSSVRALQGAGAGLVLAFSGATMALALAHPPASPAPFPWGVEAALFVSPYLLIAAGYVNPVTRPRGLTRVEHAKNLAVLVLAAPVMLVVNLYAVFTGILMSIESPHAAWQKTARATPPSRQMV